MFLSFSVSVALWTCFFFVNLDLLSQTSARPIFFFFFVKFVISLENESLGVAKCD